MASPANPKDREAALYDWAGIAVRQWVLGHFPDFETTEILDVGAGWGKYRDLLPEYRNMDACEVWEPYIEQENLAARYRYVYQADVFHIQHLLPVNWGLVIFGDVLEHLKRADAQAVLEMCHAAVVVVPFRYHQDAEGGNPYEKHWQDDLTPRLMRDLYPDLTEVAIQSHGNRPFKGLYVKGPN